MPPRLRPRPEPSNHYLNTATVADLLARARTRRSDPEPVVLPAGSRLHPFGPREISSVKLKAALRLAVFGAFDKIAEPMSLGAAFRAAGLSQKAARRLSQSPAWIAALAEAQAERARQEAAQRPAAAPSAPIAALPPPIEPEPTPARQEAACERDTADEIMTMRLDALHENVGAIVSAPADSVECEAPAPMPVDGKILKSGEITSRSPAIAIAPLCRALPALIRNSTRPQAQPQKGLAGDSPQT